MTADDVAAAIALRLRDCEHVPLEGADYDLVCDALVDAYAAGERAGAERERERWSAGVDAAVQGYERTGSGSRMSLNEVAATVLVAFRCRMENPPAASDDSEGGE